MIDNEDSMSVDDDTASRIRESLKKELKLIQHAKKDLRIKKRKRSEEKYARSSASHSTVTLASRSSTNTLVNENDYVEQVHQLK